MFTLFDQLIIFGIVFGTVFFTVFYPLFFWGDPPPPTPSRDSMK